MKYISIILKFIIWIAPALGILAAVVSLIAVSIFAYRKLRCLHISEYVLRQRKKKLERKQNRLARLGIWSFPSETFFRKCAENHIEEFKSDYSIQKATNILLELASQYGIRQENLVHYLVPAQFQKYYSQGKEIADHKDNTESQRKKQPRKASPLYSESVFLRRVANLAVLSGLDKRQQMFSYLLGDYQDRIKFKRTYDVDPGIFEKAMILHPQEDSSHNTPAPNTSVLENTAYLLSGVPDLPYSIEYLQECITDIATRQEALRRKVVLHKPTAAQILDHLHICSTQVKKSDNGVLHITLQLRLKQPFELDVPAGIPMTIDGVLQGTVMFENIPVGEVLFPLPLYGIPCNTDLLIELTGLCAFFVEFDQSTESWTKFSENDSPFGTSPLADILEDLLDDEFQALSASRTCPGYTVKIASKQNLWIMET